MGPVLFIPTIFTLFSLTLGALLPIIPAGADTPAPILAHAYTSQSSRDPHLRLAEAEALRASGDYQTAAERFRDVAESDPHLSRAAWLGLGASLLASRQHAAAADAYTQVVRLGGADELRGKALVQLAQIRRDQGNCHAAVALLYEAEPLLDLGPYLPLERAACLETIRHHEAAADEAQRALALASTRAGRTAALDRLASSAVQSGDLDAAVRWNQELLDTLHTSTHWYTELIRAHTSPGYRTSILFRLAEAQLEQGDHDAALLNFRNLVVDFPSSPWAARSLEALKKMGRETVLSHAQAGRVLFYQGRYADAIGAFAAYLYYEPRGPEASSARYFTALSRLRQGDDQGAAEALVRLALDAPGSSLAPASLYRAGRVLASIGQDDAAAQAFELLAANHPHTATAAEGRFNLGFINWRHGRYDQALATWTALADDHRAPSHERARALLWVGIAHERAGAFAEAEAAWVEAAALTPTAYYGLRAAARLADLGLPSANPAPNAGEDADAWDVDAWFETRGLDWAAVIEDVRLHPGYRLAMNLLDVGLDARAGAELSAVAQDVEDSPVQLFALSSLLDQARTQHLSLNFALIAAGRLDVPQAELPLPLQRLLYPLPYSALLDASSAASDVDPLLFASLLRQESNFYVLARSSAGALGLAQVMPQTGQLIADSLGVADFHTQHLLEPEVSLRFGAWYLAGQLRRYEGELFPSLAAYNAGAGAVNRWLRTFDASDPDLFAEQIPFPETYNYVRALYRNYEMYQRLYR